MKKFLFKFSPLVLFGVCVATLAGYFSAVYFVFDLICNFRFQYACLALILAGIFSAQKRRTHLVLAVLCFLPNAIECLPFYFPRAPSLRRSESAPTPVTVFFANVERRNENYEGLFQLLRNEKPQVAIFTEVNERWANKLKEIGETFPYAISKPREDKYGMILFSRFPLVEKEIYETAGLPVSGLTFDIVLDVEGRHLHLLASHNLAPLSQANFDKRNAVLESLAEYVNAKNLATVLVGDLNVTPLSSYFRKLLSTAHLLDARAGRGYFPSWPTHTFPLLVPIDHCLHDSSTEITDFYTLRGSGSDHTAIVCKIGLKELGGS